MSELREEHIYRRQFIVAPRLTTLGHLAFREIDIGDRIIYAHADLDVTVSDPSLDRQAVVIGIIIDPSRPERGNQEIADHLAGARGIGELCRHLDTLTGRYVVLFRAEETLVVIGDACHLRQIYFSTSAETVGVITSSPRLFLEAFGYSHKLCNSKREVIKSREFATAEQAWFGSSAIDDRLTKLLPNRLLDIHSGAVTRRSVPILEVSTDEEVRDYTAELLKGTFTALARRYSLMQPITAGIDSRLLLAASRSMSSSIKYYVFERPGGCKADISIPRLLTRRVGIEFQVLQAYSLRPDFIELYNRQHVIPRILPKTANIQYHYDSELDQSVVNVNGNALAVAKCPYGYARREIRDDVLVAMSGYRYPPRLIADEIAAWSSEARPFSKLHGVSLLAMFYWEQRMGNWGALFPAEQDIAVEEISPCNNRSLLWHLLTIDGRARRAPGYLLYRHVISALWPTLLVEPINPHVGRLANRVKGSARARYLSTRLRRSLGGVRCV